MKHHHTSDRDRRRRLHTARRFARQQKAAVRNIAHHFRAAKRALREIGDAAARHGGLHQ